MTPAPPVRVAVVCPGRLDGRGGIAAMMRHAVTHWQIHGGPTAVVLDTWREDARRLWPLLTLRAMVRLALAARYTDLVHVNVAARGSTWRKSLMVALARRLGLPVLLHVHSGHFEAFLAGLGPRRLARVRRMFASADLVVVLGRRMRGVIQRHLQLDEDRLAVLPNALPLPAAPAPARAEARIVFLGRLTVDKGAPELLAALADPALADAGWTAVLAGPGDLAGWRQRAAALGLGDRVTFPGWLDPDAAGRLLATSDVSVLPSHVEGMPMAVLEGLAHGHAVVATPVGEVPDLVEDGVTGLLVPVGDAGALAGALARVVADADLRRRLGSAGRTRAAERFDVRDYAPRLTSLYERVLARRRAGR